MEATGNDVIDGDDVIDEGRGLGVDEDGVQDRHSIYDNEADEAWWWRRYYDNRLIV